MSTPLPIQWDKLKAILIDFDGTLVDSLPALYKVYLDFLNYYNKQGSYEEFLTLNGPTITEIAAYLGEKYEISKRIDLLSKRYHEMLSEAYQSDANLFFGAIQFIEWAQGKNLTLCIVSSADRSLIESSLLKHHLSEFFIIPVFDETHRKGKPDPFLYNNALATLQLEPDQTLAIEDSPNGIISATAAGIPTIALHMPASDLATPILTWEQLLIYFEEHWKDRNV